MKALIAALTVLTLNTNGLRDSHKWSDLWSEIPYTDIICLQEMHLSSAQEYAFQLHVQGYNYFFSHGTSASCGVATLVQ